MQLQWEFNSIYLFIYSYLSIVHQRKDKTFACKYIAVLIISETIKKVLDSKQELGLLTYLNKYCVNKENTG